MLRFLARRTVWGVVTLLIFVTFTFFLIQILIPYDFSVHFIGAPVEVRLEVNERLGLDRPLVERWVDYMMGLLSLDLGEAWGGGDVVATVIGSLSFTLLIFALGGAVAYVLGGWLGRIIAWHRRGVLSGSATTLAVAASSLFPPFLVFVLIYLLTGPMFDIRAALGMPVDSLDLWRDQAVDEEQVVTLVGWSLLVALVAAIPLRAYARRHRHRWMVTAALPICLLGVVSGVVLSGLGWPAVDLMFRANRSVNIGAGSPLVALIGFVLLSVGETMFVVRTGMAAERDEDYILVARAKGLPEWVVRDRHAAANNALPAMTRFLYGIPLMLTGLIIIEREMMLEGLSTVFFDALQAVDVPLIMGILVLLGCFGIVLRLGLDVTYAILDPRIRIEADV